MRLAHALPTPLLVLAAASASAQAGLSFEHRDWQLACDNTRTCRAAGYTSDDAGAEDTRASLLLTRHAGPAAPVQVSAYLGEWPRAPQAPVHLHLGGRRVGAVLPAHADDPLEYGPFAQAQVQALLAALRGTVRIELVDASGLRWPVSGSGASAVLLRMDEFQQRLGTVGALVRKGSADERGVAPPLPAPRLRKAALLPTTAADRRLADAPALRQALQAELASDDEGCDGLEAGTEAPLQVERLSAHALLASTRCWSAAYNSGTGFWVVEDRPPFRATRVTLDGSDHDAGTISALQKGRGIADCIWNREWTWDGERFVPTLETSSGMCRAITPGGPWNLPTRVAEVVDP